MPRSHSPRPRSNLGDLRRSDASFSEQSLTPRDLRRRSLTADEATALLEQTRETHLMVRPEAERAFFERVSPTHVGSARIPSGPGTLPAPRNVTATAGSCNRDWRFFRDFTSGPFHCIRIQWRGGPRDVSYEVERRIVNRAGLELGFQRMPPDTGTASIDIWLPADEAFSRLVYRVRATDGRGFSEWTTRVFRKPSWHDGLRYKRLAFGSVIEGKPLGKKLALTPLTLPFVPPTEDEADGFRRLIAGSETGGAGPRSTDWCSRPPERGGFLSPELRKRTG